jgi:hypothetical protein
MKEEKEKKRPSPMSECEKKIFSDEIIKLENKNERHIICGGLI